MSFPFLGLNDSFYVSRFAWIKDQVRVGDPNGPAFEQSVNCLGFFALDSRVFLDCFINRFFVVFVHVHSPLVANRDDEKGASQQGPLRVFFEATACIPQVPALLCKILNHFKLYIF
tara:strand:+ start:570 stop:917 length:348 start_codon:yes stop_codon:yes gene_type:complete